MACNRPIVATELGDVGILLKNFKESLCKEGDKKDMMEKIKLQLNAKRVDYRKAAMKNSWDNIALKLDVVLGRQ